MENSKMKPQQIQQPPSESTFKIPSSPLLGFSEKEVYTILNQLNLKLAIVKDASTSLLRYTESSEGTSIFARIWMILFEEKRHSERDRMSLFFVLHELLHRSRSTSSFRSQIFDPILACIVHVSTTDHARLKQEIANLIKMWSEHHIFDARSILRLTVQLHLEDASTKQEMLHASLPSGLPNPPQELLEFTQNMKELAACKARIAQNHEKLQLVYEYVRSQINGTAKEYLSPHYIDSEINSNLAQLKRNLELENSHRVSLLKSYKEVLMLLDKQHMKTIIELKLFLQKTSKLEIITHQSALSNEFQDNHTRSSSPMK